MKKVLCAAALATFPMLVSCDSTSTSSSSPKMEKFYSNAYGRCYLGSSDNMVSMSMEYDTPYFSVYMEMENKLNGSVIDGKIRISTANEMKGLDKTMLISELCEEYKQSLVNSVENLTCYKDHIEGNLVSEPLPSYVDASTVLQTLESALKRECREGVESMDESFGRASSSTIESTPSKYKVTSCDVIPTDEVITQVIAGDGFNIVSEARAEGSVVYINMTYSGIDSELINQQCQLLDLQKNIYLDLSCNTQSTSASMVVEASKIQSVGEILIEDAQDECQDLLNGTVTVEEFFLDM